MALMGIDWGMGLALLLGGGVVGVLLGRLFGGNGGREKRLAEELEQTKQELTTYRSSVENHFRETAEAVNEMTESYRRVHEKLRSGAEQLCGDSGALLELRGSPRLEQQSQVAEAEPPADSATEEQDATPAVDSAQPQDEAAAEPGETPQAQGESEPAEASAESPENEPDEEAKPADPGESAEQGEADETPEKTEDTTVTQPLDYAVDGEAQKRDKTIH